MRLVFYISIKYYVDIAYVFPCSVDIIIKRMYTISNSVFKGHSVSRVSGFQITLTWPPDYKTFHV